MIVCIEKEVLVNSEDIVAVIRPENMPQGKKAHIIMTPKKKARSAIFLKTGDVLLVATTPETVFNKIYPHHSEEESRE